MTALFYELPLYRISICFFNRHLLWWIIHFAELPRHLCWTHNKTKAPNQPISQDKIPKLPGGKKKKEEKEEEGFISLSRIPATIPRGLWHIPPSGLDLGASLRGSSWSARALAWKFGECHKPPGKLGNTFISVFCLSLGSRPASW